MPIKSYNTFVFFASVTYTEDVIPPQTTKTTVNTTTTTTAIVPNGTYVIRKGRDRKHVFDIPEFVPNDVKGNQREDDEEEEDGAEADVEIESALESSQELLSIEEPNDIPQPPINIPKYRHSIDLALPAMQNSIHSAKYVFIFELIFVE